LWVNFKALFVIIEAAGGLVKNNAGAVLFIYRNDKWDLPKGKIEPNEAIEQAAMREVKEECGIENELLMVRKIIVTHHLYAFNNQRVLKHTHWFEMLSSKAEQLTPQIEENITAVEWLHQAESYKVWNNTYPLIKEVLNY